MALTREGLACPAAYLQAADEVRRAICNGCGAAGSKFDFVPDTIYCLPIQPACNIHDWMYHHGRTIADKEEADRTFLNNLLRLIEHRTGWKARLLKPLRRRRALKYYESVLAFGGPAFWVGKNG